ncbi:uncharacterized protein LOC118202488 [Stegodyphus dumicola]|uniref:uncharacterized protein LOC118202488 n=1 Tax=Stegodyphus dumicola TaxID=202533 RepID=UPI0015B1A5E6|nr:uncharacterized protein LOC118202488 [Stegodyphus dumicola]
MMYNSVPDSSLKPTAFLCFLCLFASLARGNEFYIPRFSEACDIFGLHIKASFYYPFSGMMYSKDKLCSEIIPEKSPALTVSLDLPLSACGSQVIGTGPYYVNNTITVEYFNSSYAIKNQILCEIPPIEDNSWTEKRGSNWNSYRVTDLNLWFDLKSASEVDMDLPQLNSSNELFLIFHMKDEGQSKDMRIHNCYTNDVEINTATVHRLSDPVGCPRSYDILTFSIIKHKMPDILAYALINFAVPLKNALYLTCDVVLCKNVCPDFCNYTFIKHNTVKHSKVKNIDEAHSSVFPNRNRRRNHRMVPNVKNLTAVRFVDKQKNDTDFEGSLRNFLKEKVIIKNFTVVPETKEIMELPSLQEGRQINSPEKFFPRNGSYTRSLAVLPSPVLNVITDLNDTNISSGKLEILNLPFASPWTEKRDGPEISNSLPLFGPSRTTQKTLSNNKFEDIYETVTFEVTAKLSAMPQETISQIIRVSKEFTPNCTIPWWYTLLICLLCIMLVCLTFGCILFIRRPPRRTRNESQGEINLCMNRLD